MSILLKQCCLLLSLGGLIYFLRVSGFWLAGRIRFNKFIKIWLEHLPGCVMMAVVSPVLLSKDWLTYFACVVVAIVFLKTKNLFLAMCFGVFLVVFVHCLN